MINGNVNEFLDELTYEDHYVLYKGKKYFFNGCQCQFDSNHKVISATIGVYNFSDNKELASFTENSIVACIDALSSAKLFDGKSFWDVEAKMEWIDG